jgi:WG containing repeat
MAVRSGITIFPFRRYRYPSDPMLDILKFLRPRKPETPDSSTQLLLPVEINAKWGYIDAHGELAIDAQFDSVGSFEEGRAAVEVDYDYWSRGSRSIDVGLRKPNRPILCSARLQRQPVGTLPGCR